MRSPFEQALQTVGKWAEELVREETEGQPPDDPQPSEETKALFVLLDNVPCDELRAAGVRILNEAEDPETLVALMEARYLVQECGVNPWPWFESRPRTPARDALIEFVAGSEKADILTLRDALRAREESERT